MENPIFHNKTGGEQKTQILHKTASFGAVETQDGLLGGVIRIS